MDTTIVREVSVNYRGGENLGETLRQPEEVAAAFRQILPDNSREHVMALYLNGAHKVIAYSLVSTGTATSAPVHPRELYQPAILVGATAVLLGHNHPSGSTEPSVEDYKITKSLKAAAEVLGLKLLDHLVISDRDYFSFHSNGALWGPRRYRSIGSAFATGRRIGESGSQSLPRSSRGGDALFFSVDSLGSLMS